MPVDNAAADTFFAALKNEMYYRESFATRVRARFAVAAYIEVFYNRQRLHSTLSYRTPLKALTKFHTRTRRRSWPWTPARRPAVARLPSLRRTGSATRSARCGTHERAPSSWLRRHPQPPRYGGLSSGQQADLRRAALIAQRARSGATARLQPGLRTAHPCRRRLWMPVSVLLFAGKSQLASAASAAFSSETTAPMAGGRGGQAVLSSGWCDGTVWDLVATPTSCSNDGVINLSTPMKPNSARP
ncbi:MAG: IS3 family transposase [Geodermatophilaceae bacterium]|nr:IS3 family transposase [Geodermatophilaceae bacterium]